MKKITCLVVWLCVSLVLAPLGCDLSGYCAEANKMGGSILCIDHPLPSPPAVDPSCPSKPGTVVWECNVVGGPNTVPNPGPGHAHFVGASCGSFYCATSETDAKNQSGAPEDPSLSCATVLPTWTSCITLCNACDDGQGGFLQNVGEHCGNAGPQCCPGYCWFGMPGQKQPTGRCSCNAIGTICNADADCCEFFAGAKCVGKTTGPNGQPGICTWAN
jgi:hypothetical protein